MKWKTKAALFRALDVLPFGSALHFAAQRYVTRSWPRSPASTEALIKRAETFVACFREHGPVPVEQATFLEIGAGRDLTVPLALRGLGVQRVITVDIRPLAKLDLVRLAAERVAARFPGVAVPRSWDELLAAGVDYRAPFNVADETVPPIHAFVSNEVLEHVPAADLPALLKGATSRLVAGGLSLHTIDYSDHFARGGGVPRLNFLRYSDAEWARFNSAFQYVNRLRHSDYVECFEAAGLRLLASTTRTEALPDILAERFRRYAPETLSISSAFIAAVRG